MGSVYFCDSRIGIRPVSINDLIFCELTLKGGEIKWDWDSCNAVDWRELPELYGTRGSEGLVMPPEKK